MEHKHPDTDQLAGAPAEPETAEPRNGRPRLYLTLLTAALVFTGVAMAAIVAAVAVNQWMTVESLTWRGGTCAVAMLAWAVAAVCGIAAYNTRPQATRNEIRDSLDQQIALLTAQRIALDPPAHPAGVDTVTRRRPSPRRRRERTLVTVGADSGKEVSR